MPSFQLLLFPRKRKVGPERLSSVVPGLTAAPWQDWGNDARFLTSGPEPLSGLDLEKWRCPGHGGGTLRTAGLPWTA